ncbi:(S)-1-Phenylethanol dehydrogenase [uncultured Desulfobacterium sp.]|uniref:(S)-1-Phenylethanol dehydrogenase n=1 Tax=uncultured Desulfobacterium sp. TaxID=201089 RepID=A0A445N1A1_9BACT|nr:(S)-1-Phenylethanol dehydrogenase [uncultured Desulfobacterium sp.]
MRLKDKVAIITGGGQGIGREYALRFCKEGARVVIAEINLENAKKVEKEIVEMGGEALAIKTDVSSENDTQVMAQKTVEKFGKIDILINNAAIYFGLENKPIENITVDEWDRSFAVNVRGAWLCIKAVLPYMKDEGSGRIINISSGTWYMGIPMLLHYGTTKAGIIGLTRCAAREVGGFGINVNAITPGFTTTEASLTMKGTPPGIFEVIAGQTALGRNENAEDLVGTAVFLASDDSAFITGQSIVVDGGWVLD